MTTLSWILVGIIVVLLGVIGVGVYIIGKGAETISSLIPTGWGR